MAKADIAALLALGAAFFIAIGDVIHQRRRTRSPTNRSATSTCSCACCATASGGWAAWSPPSGSRCRPRRSGFGSVLLVQALLVTSLLFALPINARLTHRRVTRWEWTWAALLAAVGRRDRHRRQPDRRALPRVVGDVDGGDRRARARPGAVRGRRADLVGTGQRGAAGGGVRRAVGGVRGADQGRGGPARRRHLGAAAHAELYAWALVAIAGTAWQQSSFRAGCADRVAADDDGHRAGGRRRCSASSCSARRCGRATPAG